MRASERPMVIGPGPYRSVRTDRTPRRGGRGRDVQGAVFMLVVAVLVGIGLVTGTPCRALTAIVGLGLLLFVARPEDR